jgi:plasmid maintenance system killer protein
MILDFADEATEDIFHGNRSKAARRCLPPGLWPAARRKLDRLNRAREPRELADPPGNRLDGGTGPSRSPIPPHVDHLFHAKPITDSAPCRSLNGRAGAGRALER